MSQVGQSNQNNAVFRPYSPYFWISRFEEEILYSKFSLINKSSDLTLEILTVLKILNTKLYIRRYYMRSLNGNPCKKRINSCELLSLNLLIYYMVFNSLDIL